MSDIEIVFTKRQFLLLLERISRNAGGRDKGTPFAATQIANKLAKELLGLGVRSIEVNMQGPGSGRDSVVRALQASGLNVTVLRDVTPLPHNGTRPPKKRRI